MFVLNSVNAEDDKQVSTCGCVKFFQRNIFNANVQYRNLYAYIRKSFFGNLLEPKRMPVFSLKLDYLKVLRNFFKKKSKQPYEIH